MGWCYLKQPKSSKVRIGILPRGFSRKVMSLQEPYIRFDNVKVVYTEYITGLHGVSLDIERGEFVFLCGHSGSGKSTLLKSLTAQIELTSGSVIFNGKEVSKLTEEEIPLHRRQMGIIPQDFGLLPNKKVWENVGYAMRAVGRSRADVRREVPKILDRVSMMHRADSYPGQISGGEQQRVAIARALINEPPLLIADEPTGNLDPANSNEIIDLLLHLNERGTTVIVATHDMPTVQRTNKRIVWMEKGYITTVPGDTELEVPVTGEGEEA